MQLVTMQRQTNMYGKDGLFYRYYRAKITNYINVLFYIQLFTNEK